MKRILLTILIILIPSLLFPITQTGYVKTIARKDKASTPVEDVVIRVRGTHNAVKSHKEGNFSLLLHNLNNGEPYAIASIIKSGYEPAEQGLVGRTIACSDIVPLEVLLVNTQELQLEKEAIAAKARENVEVYYTNKLSILEQQLAEKQITEKEFNKRLQELESRYERFEPLLQTISNSFARTDYDKLDSLTLLIHEAIEAGNPEEAERLVREKGNLNEREKHIRTAEGEILAAEHVLEQTKRELENQRQIVVEQKRDLAGDYYRLYASFFPRFENDSAAIYICRRAELDTLNVDYQLQAGQFMKEIMADYPSARIFFERAYRVALLQYGDMSAQMSTTCHELGALCKIERQPEKSLSWYEKALRIKENVRGKKSPAVAETLNNLAELYREKKDYANAMKLHKKACKIREKAFGKESIEVAESQNNIAGLLYQQGRLQDAEKMFLAVRNIYAFKPSVSQRLVAGNYNNLGAVCYAQGKYEEALHCFQQATDIYNRTLGEKHPLTQNAMRNKDICNSKLHTNP